MKISWDNPSLKRGETLIWGHLGGTATGGDPNSWYPDLWTWLIEKFDLRSALDVGCGVGYSQKFLQDSGLGTLGLDCLQMKEFHLLKDRFVAHDLTSGPYIRQDRFDFVWCCEVAEHLEERFSWNIVETVAQNCNKVLAFCAAPPKSDGYHHVNCQLPLYWRGRIEAAGLKYNEELSNFAHENFNVKCGRTKEHYFQRSGQIFLRTNSN